MYSRYLNRASYTPQMAKPPHPSAPSATEPPPKPLPKKIKLDRTDLLILLIIFLTMQDDRTTMLLTAALYLFM